MRDQNSTAGRRAGRWPPNWVSPRERGPAHRRPRWVAVLGALVVVLVVVMVLAGHGPGRHMRHALGGPVTPGSVVERLG